MHEALISDPVYRYDVYTYDDCELIIKFYEIDPDPYSVMSHYIAPTFIPRNKPFYWGMQSLKFKDRYLDLDNSHQKARLTSSIRYDDYYEMYAIDNFIDVVQRFNRRNY